MFLKEHSWKKAPKLRKTDGDVLPRSQERWPKSECLLIDTGFKLLSHLRNLRSKLSYLVLGLSNNLPGNRQAFTSFFLSVGLLKALLRRPEI